MKSLLLAVRFVCGRALLREDGEGRRVYCGEDDFAAALLTMQVTEAELRTGRTTLLLVRYPFALRRIDCVHGGSSV